MFFIVAVSIYIPSSMQKDSLFSTFLLKLFIFCLFDNSHSNRCGVISHCGFNCISLMIISKFPFACCYLTSIILLFNLIDNPLICYMDCIDRHNKK